MESLTKIIINILIIFLNNMLPNSTPIHTQSNPTQNYSFALGVMASLFFTFGFITCLNDILSPYLQKLLKLNYTQTSLVQVAFFLAYFVISPPSSFIIQKIGYKMGMALGLLLSGVGCAMFYPASVALSYPLFLCALFVLAGGIALLQTASNPYISALGNPETSSSRLALVQAFNSVGTTIAPFVGTYLLLQNTKNTTAQDLQVPYLMLGLAFFGLAILVYNLSLPAIQSEVETQSAEDNAKTSALQYPQLVLGIIGIFVYVGAEVAIGTYLTNFLGEPHIANLPKEKAGYYVSFYWGGAMIGRFLGAYLMQQIKPAKVLMFNGLLAFVLVNMAIFGNGNVAMYALLAVGFANSIMFPTIFTLAIKGLGKYTAQGSGLLCMAIVGGAVVPLLQGICADNVNLQVSFVIPMLCYVYIAWFGYKVAP